MSDGEPQGERSRLRTVRGGRDRERDRATDEATLRLERALLAGVLVDPDRLGDVLAIVSPSDFGNPGHAAVADAMGRLHGDGLPVTLEGLLDDLARVGKLNLAGGATGLAELSDATATAEFVNDHARRVRRRALEREEARVSARLATGGADAEDRSELRRIQDALASAAEVSAAVEEIVLTGERLRAVRERPQPESPLPGILDPEPHLHVVAGRPKSGKTTFALALARAWAQGVAPWVGAPALPGSRALVVSREQPVARLDGVLRRLSLYSEAGSIERLTDRVLLAARDPELPAAGRRLLTLDEEGVAALRGLLADARRAGDPIGLVLLDSLSRLRPPELEENANDQVAGWLDSLEAVAAEESAWTLLIHHQGHNADPGRQDARSAGRGASAIAACAQVVLLLERGTDDPRTRILKIDGNAVLPAEMTFRVAGPDAEVGAIHYFEPTDPLDAYAIDELIGPGEDLSTSALAWRIAGEDAESGGRPPGYAMRTAKALRATWSKRGIVDAYETRSAKRLRREGTA